jgi:hypothetical protein
LRAEPGDLWAVLDDVPAYPAFWPWLRRFDGRRLVVGEVWHGTIAAVGPLRLTVAVHLDEVVPGRSGAARGAGPRPATARLALAPDPAGTALHLTAVLVPERPALRVLTRWARPLAQASHDRVIARALSQLGGHVSA